MKKTLLTAGLFCLSLIANAQCTAVTNFNETFANFTNGALPQNCWTGSTGSPKLLVATSGADKALQLYAFMTPTVPFYVVSNSDTRITSIAGVYGLGKNPAGRSASNTDIVSSSEYPELRSTFTFVLIRLSS